jgi:hypothetical protein
LGEAGQGDIEEDGGEEEAGKGLRRPKERGKS